MYRFLTAVHDAVSFRKITILEENQRSKREFPRYAAPRALCPPCCRLWAGVWPRRAEVGYGYHPAHLGACWGAFRCAESEAGRIWAAFQGSGKLTKAKQEKGAASWTPPPRSLLPAVRAVAPFHQRRRRREFSAGGGVENRNDPAVTGKAAGSRQKFKEESRDDK